MLSDEQIFDALPGGVLDCLSDPWDEGAGDGDDYRSIQTDVLRVARAVEAEVRKDDEALIRQLVEALEHIHRCIPMGGFAQIHWGSSTFEQTAQAAEDGRARPSAAAHGLPPDAHD